MTSEKEPSIAIISTGGKQYLVSPSQQIKVERVPQAVGERLKFDDWLGSKQVTAKVVAHGLNPKIRIVKFKPKTRYKRLTGHRQTFTTLAIESIK